MIRRRIELYLRRTKMAPTRFGIEVTGERAFVSRLRNGAEPRDKTVAKITAWLDEQEAK